MAIQRSIEPGALSPDTPVRELMTRAVARISPEARIDELARKLSAVEVGAVGVGTTQSLVGIVSERDLTRAYGKTEGTENLRVSDITSKNIIWCELDTSATAAARVMVERGVRHLLVGDDSIGDLQGIISARDLMGALIGPLVTPESATSEASGD
ncbi:MAG: CBS domain-containing protein [Acidimicrobiales bacterium]